MSWRTFGAVVESGGGDSSVHVHSSVNVCFERLQYKEDTNQNGQPRRAYTLRGKGRKNEESGAHLAVEEVTPRIRRHLAAQRPEISKLGHRPPPVFLRIFTSAVKVRMQVEVRQKGALAGLGLARDIYTQMHRHSLVYRMSYGGWESSVKPLEGLQMW